MAQENTSTGTPAPHPVPHALHAGHAAPPVPLAETTPSTWGRIDDEGTVYVITAEGERAVGAAGVGGAAGRRRAGGAGGGRAPAAAAGPPRGRGRGGGG